MDANDTDGRLKRYMAFDDNMEVVLKMVNEVHNNHYDIQDFDMVTSTCLAFCYVYS